MRLIAVGFFLLNVCFGVPSIAQEGTVPAALFSYSAGGNACREVPISVAPSGTTIDRERKQLVQALEWFSSAISSAKASPKMAKRLGIELYTLAESDAFTRLDWSGSGSSPAHWQTNLLKNVAIAVNVVDHRGTWEIGQRVKVVGWGNEIFKSTHYTRNGRSQSDRWPDTVATAAAGYILWGIAAPNKAALSEGMSDFKKVARMLQPTGGTQSYFGENERYTRNLPDGWGTRIEDKLLGDLVIAAHAAGRVGKDLFTAKIGKVSLYSAVVGWQSTLFADGGAAVTGEDMSFLTRSGQERSWGWTEYFVANFPADAATETLRRKSSQIRGAGYVGLATGPATCLLR